MAQLDDLEKYVDEWTRMQIVIWKEKIERLRVVRSGTLHESFTSAIQRSSAGAQTITLKFAQYGIYQALGTGRGYAKGNGGDLQFLDKQYRKDNRLDQRRRVGPAWGGYKTSGKPRKRRDWYFKKLYSSTMAMVEDLAVILAETCANVVCEQLTDAHSAIV